MDFRLPPKANRFKSLIKAGQFIRNPFPILDQAIQDLGTTYTFYMGGVQQAVLTVDPVAIRHILQKNHRAYEKSMLVTDLLAKYTGRGLLTSTGDYWLRQRRLIQPGFHKRRIEALKSLMDSEIQVGMRRWESFIGKPFDAYAEMNRLAFRIVARTLFSTSIEEQGLHRLSEVISSLQSFIVREVRQPHKRLWFKWSGAIKKHLHMAAEARDIIRLVIRQRQNAQEKPDDLLTMLLESVYEDSGLGMDEEQLIDECLILFVAGHETSANALSWMMYLLGKHQAYVERICSADPEAKHVLTRNLIMETMRLYPPAWVVDRVSEEEDTVLDYHLPAGTMWIIYIRGMHRNPVYWDEPDRFNPDRWNEPEKTKDAFLPFGAGPRMCIGEHFALMEMQLIIESVLEHWDFDLLTDEVRDQPLVTLRPLDEVKILIRPRQPVNQA